jgi:hypothetical protein
MNDCDSRLFEEITNVLASGRTPPRVHLLRLAAEWVEVCRRVNLQARRCRSLLKKGRIEKALEVAASIPALDSTSDALEFPGVCNWEPLLLANGLDTRKDAVNQVLVDNVLQVIAGGRPTLKSLLATHRRLALRRAPLADRVRVLTELVRVDPTQQGWIDDLQRLQDAHRRELRGRAARAREDLESLEGVLREFHSVRWLQSPETDIAHVESLAAPLRKAAAAARCGRLAVEIHRAHEREDETECVKLLGEWEDSRSNLGDDDVEGAANAASARAWLDELEGARDRETQYRADCEILEALVTSGGRLEELDASVANVESHGRGLPGYLKAQVEALRLKLQRARKRRRTATVLSALAILVVLVVSSVKVVPLWLAGQEASRRCEAIAKRFDRIEADSAPTSAAPRERRQKLKSSLWHAGLPRLTAEVADLDHRRPHDLRVQCLKDRLAALERERDSLRRWLQDHITETERRTAAGGDRQEIEQTLEDLQTLAVLEGEDDDVEAARSRVQSLWTKADRAERERRMRELQEVERLLGVKDYGQARKKIEEIAPGCAADAETSTRLAALRKSLLAGEAGEQRDAQFKRLAGMGLDPRRLAPGLRSFLSSYGPDDLDLAREFQSALDSEPSWHAAHDWWSTSRRWPSLDVHDRTAAGERLAAVEAHLAGHRQSPYRAGLEEYRKLLRNVVNIVNDDRSLAGEGELRLLLASRFLNPPLYDIETRTGERYYLLDDESKHLIKEGGVVTSQSFEVLLDHKLRTEKRNFSTADLRGKPRRAPQVEFARYAAEAMAKSSARRERTLFLDVCDLLLANRGIDSVYSASLARTCLSHAAYCAPAAVRGEIEAVTAKLPMDLDANWIDPADKKASELRLVLLPVLPEVHSAVKALRGKVREAAAREWRELECTLVRCEPLAVLLDAGGDTRTDVKVPSGSPDARLAVFSEQRLVEIGRFNGDSVTLDPSATRLPRGSLVFAMRPFSGKP